ncbi:hypothetical protein BASA50_001402 [Batrachochytrium salamandrivorans]|uniref:Uncharacterized protein n=1 Tax=Batrachochytrium salamandrivorans TaxID=1357716 RepID=A0ABQ8EVC2_9FUNG|nr:hypothetical protein BASA50_001402 [Batrachochytrium salamandrivorans]
MRLISLILLSFIATNTVAIYTPKVHQIEKRGLPLPAEEAEYSDTSSSEEATETSISNPNPEEEAGPSNVDPNLPGEEVETLITNSNPEDEDEVGAWILNPPEDEDEVGAWILNPPEDEEEVGAWILNPPEDEEEVGAWIPNPPEEDYEFLPPDYLLLEKEIIANGNLFPNGLNEPDSAPEELIKSSREASSPLTAEIYKSQMYELQGIILLVDQVLKSTIERERGKDECRVLQNDAIQRSRVYLQGLADIGERMARALGTMPKKSRFKDRSRLLKLVFKTEKLDKKKKKLHKTTILEETEDEEEKEEQDAKDRAIYEQSDKE